MVRLVKYTMLVLTVVLFRECMAADAVLPDQKARPKREFWVLRKQNKRYTRTIAQLQQQLQVAQAENDRLNQRQAQLEREAGYDVEHTKRMIEEFEELVDDKVIHYQKRFNIPSGNKQLDARQLQTLRDVIEKQKAALPPLLPPGHPDREPGAQALKQFQVASTAYFRLRSMWRNNGLRPLDQQVVRKGGAQGQQISVSTVDVRKEVQSGNQGNAPHRTLAQRRQAFEVAPLNL